MKMNGSYLFCAGLLLCVFFFSDRHAAAHNGKIDTPADSNVEITGRIGKGLVLDSVFVLVYDDHYLSASTDLTITPSIFVAKVKDGRFRLNIKSINLPVTISIRKQKFHNGLLDKLTVETGERLDVLLDSTNAKVFGSGANKFELRKKLDSTFNAIIYRDLPQGISELEYVRFQADLAHSILSEQLKILERYKGKITPYTYEQIHNNVVAKAQYALERIVSFDIISNHYNLAQLDTIRKILSQVRVPVNLNIPASPEVLDYEFIKVQVDSKLPGGEAAYLYYILDHYTGDFRNKLFTLAFMSAYAQIKNSDSLVAAANKILTDRWLIGKINAFHELRKAGVVAYDFQLPALDDSVVRLSQYRGRLIVIDFWFTGCRPCALYYQGCLKKVEEKFRRDNRIVFITVCVDEDKESWKKSVMANLYTSDQVINVYTAGQGREHPVVKKYGVSGYPKPLLIGKNGTILNNNIFDLGGGTVLDPDKLESLLRKNL